MKMIVFNFPVFSLNVHFIKITTQKKTKINLKFQISMYIVYIPKRVKIF